MFAPDVRSYVELLDGGGSPTRGGENPSLPIDAYLVDDALHIEIDTPGVAREHLRLRVEAHTLVVEGDRTPSERYVIDPLISHRAHGSFNYRLGLGERCDIDRVEAVAHDGVLSIAIPLVPPSPTRHITIRDGVARSERRTPPRTAATAPDEPVAATAAA